MLSTASDPITQNTDSALLSSAADAALMFPRLNPA